MIKIIKAFFKGNERTVKAKKNIVASIGIKGVSIIVGFLTIRVTLNYLDQTKYGIWLTLTSFLAWFAFFEIGLGKGLQNKLAKALAVKDYKLAKSYVSTTYALISMIFIFIAILFFIGNFFIDWPSLLNTDKIMSNELRNVAFVVFGFFFSRFILNLIVVVLLADQRTAVSNTFGPIGNLISLILIYILTLTTKGSLFYIAWVFSVMPALVLIFASIYFYRTEYSFLSPSLKFVNFNYAKDLLGLGVKFFVIQISSLVVYQSSSIIIAQFFGPDEVVVYNIGYKYFSIMIMAFSIIVMPFWSAFTEAWTKNEIDWIKNTISKLLLVWVGITVTGIVMLFFSNEFYKFWIGNKVEIPFKVSLVFLIYFSALTFGGIFRTFINGIGYIKLQMYSSVGEIIVFILSSLLLIKYFNWGVEGILIAMIFSNFYGIIIAPIQYKKLINKKAIGIWKS